MQNIFITFEAEPPQYLYTENPLHHHERGDIQYFIDVQTIIRAKRDCKFTTFYFHIQIKQLHFEEVNSLLYFLNIHFYSIFILP